MDRRVGAGEGLTIGTHTKTHALLFDVDVDPNRKLDPDPGNQTTSSYPPGTRVRRELGTDSRDGSLGELL